MKCCDVIDEDTELFNSAMDDIFHTDDEVMGLYEAYCRMRQNEVSAYG